MVNTCLVNVLLNEVEDEVTPQDRGHRVQVPIEAVEDEQFEGLEWEGLFKAKCSFFSASSTLLNGTNFSGSCIPKGRNVRARADCRVPRRRFISLLVSQGSIQ